jgi:hypothetical protein
MHDDDKVLKKFKDTYAKDLILSQMGEDAVYYADDFVVTDFFYEKYKRLVSDNKKLLAGKTLLDVGANMGHWGLLSLMDGATSVTCLEPRRQYVDGLNTFSKKHGLDISAVQGIHSDIFGWNKNFDVVMLSSIVTSIPDIFDFLKKLKGITKHVIIRHVSLRDVPTDMCKMEKTYNFTHRSSVDLRSDGYLNNKTGNQYDIKNSTIDPGQVDDGTSYWWFYGIDYLVELFNYFGYKILRLEEQKSNSPEGTLYLSDNQLFHDIVLEAPDRTV